MPEAIERRPLTPEQRRLRAKIAARTRWAKEDPAPNARRGQAGLIAKFEREADPDGTLSAAERQRRVESLRQLHMLRMAARSVEARAARKAARERQ